jgi:hypothetical protein
VYFVSYRRPYRVRPDSCCHRDQENGQLATFHVLQETIEANAEGHIATAKRAAVGPEVKVRGTPDGSANIAPDELPDCDVLEMDCDGAEIEILEKMQIRPDLIIVETHGIYDTPESDVRDALGDIGYEVVDTTVESEKHGISILTAERTTDPA